MNVADTLAIIFALCAVPIFFVLMRVTAPYGRHAREGWGRLMGRSVAFFLMEMPAPLLFSLCFFLGQGTLTFPAVAFFILWQFHYVHRAFIYPWTTSGRTKNIPVAIVFMGATFNIINSLLQGTTLYMSGPKYGPDWAYDPRFIIGVILFIAGYVLNRHADSVLSRLRKENRGYAIPNDKAFQFVSCPNYLGEIIEWVGWAIATWTWAGLAFAIWTFANLAPRAVAHHRWYLKTFPNYPRKRKALLPWLF